MWLLAGAYLCDGGTALKPSHVAGPSMSVSADASPRLCRKVRCVLFLIVEERERVLSQSSKEPLPVSDLSGTE